MPCNSAKENKGKNENSDTARVQSENEVEEQSANSSSDPLPMTSSILISRPPREDPDQRWTLETVGLILHRGTCVHRLSPMDIEKHINASLSRQNPTPLLKKETYKSNRNSSTYLLT